MVNVKITIQYDGSAYYGWQIQRKKVTGKGTLNVQTRPTVQEEVEKVLNKIFQESVKLIGASRTDAGVHALGQTANFILEDERIPLKVLIHSMNSMLPKDIMISKINKAGKSFNSRYNAKTKLYEYRILNQRYHTVLDRNFYWHIWQKLDWEKIKIAGKYLLGKHNFSAFSSAGSPRKNQFCTISCFEVKKKGNLYKMLIESDFFLYKMVRNIVGLLVQAGKGKIDSEYVKAVLKTGNINKGLETAPAKGLYLVRIKYK